MRNDYSKCASLGENSLAPGNSNRTTPHTLPHTLLQNFAMGTRKILNYIRFLSARVSGGGRGFHGTFGGSRIDHSSRGKTTGKNTWLSEPHCTFSSNFSSHVVMWVCASFNSAAPHQWKGEPDRHPLHQDEQLLSVVNQLSTVFPRFSFCRIFRTYCPSPKATDVPHPSLFE